MNNPCPYCVARPRGSDDHAFPDFLGGTRKVQSCTTCNNRFGHHFEGPVSKDLAPIIVFLSFSGYKHKHLVVHERAWLDETTGIEYDLDSRCHSYPSKPHIIREDGKVKRIVARSSREAHKIVASLKAKGHVKEVVEKNEIKEGLRPPLQNVLITVGTEMRQLAVKMCVAVGQLVVPDIVLLDDGCRQFLLDETPTSSPVRQAYSRYPELDARRPPLAHAVYIEGDSRSAKCFGIVQLFGGAFQFYVPMSDRYTGRDFAGLGILDVSTFREEFQETKRLQLPETPQFIGQDELDRALADWATDFNSQVQAAFGRNAIVFGTSSKQSVVGVRITLPLLWVEHEVEIQVTMDLLPDHETEKNVTLSTNPRDWIFSPDFGNTRLPVFDTFAHKWNNNELNRTLGQEHVYLPEEIVPGVRLLMSEAFWCPVQSMNILYRVHRQAWLGSVDLLDCSGELDQSQHTLQTKIKVTQDDIPMSRNPSWPPIADPDDYEKAAQYILVAEKWDIDVDNLRFTGFRAEPDAVCSARDH